jgi:4-oxalocrotonate tautomerase
VHHSLFIAMAMPGKLVPISPVIHLSHYKEYNMPVVRVTWFEGKEPVTKAVVAKEITESIVKHTGTDPAYIYVIFEDVKPSNWAGAGQMYA